MLPRMRLVTSLVTVTVAAVAVASPAAAEASRPDLGAASPYVVVADQSIASTGATVITGGVAIAATTNLTGFPPGTIDRAPHLADQEARDVARAATAAGQDLAGQACTSDRTGEDQGGLRLGSGVYCYIEPATLDGELRLDALGDRDAVWVFQVGGAFDASAGSKVLLANGAQSCNVFWQVDGPVTIGAGATMVGTIVSDGNIILGEGATLDGRLFTGRGTVVLTGNTISQSACVAARDVGTTTTVDPNTTSTVPATDTTTPASDSSTANGTGSGSRSRDGSGSGPGGEIIALTGPASMLLAASAFTALMAGHALVGAERVVAWRARRWRPRHALPRAARLRRSR